MTNFSPKPEHKIPFGFWMIGNVGRDPYGSPLRETKSPIELVYLLADVSAWGVNFHETEIGPFDATPLERD